MAGSIEVSLWRGKEDGRYQAFSVPLRENQTVLDVVTLGAAPRRPDARLPLRLPGRHVRQLRHDRQRPPALDVPHAHLEGRRGRPRRDRPARQPTAHQGPRLRHGRVLREVAEGQGCLCAEQVAAATESRGSRRPPRRASPPTPPSSASIAPCAIRPAIRCAGTRTIWAPPPSTAPGRWSTTCATRAPRAARRAGGERRLPRLPLAPELPGALPQGAQPHRLHRRPQAPHDAGVHPGRAVMDHARAAHATVIPGFMPGTHRAANCLRQSSRDTCADGARGWLDPGDKPRDDNQ